MKCFQIKNASLNQKTFELSKSWAKTWNEHNPIEILHMINWFKLNNKRKQNLIFQHSSKLSYTHLYYMLSSSMLLYNLIVPCIICIRAARRPIETQVTVKRRAKIKTIKVYLFHHQKQRIKLDFIIELIRKLYYLFVVAFKANAWISLPYTPIFYGILQLPKQQQQQHSKTITKTTTKNRNLISMKIWNLFINTYECVYNNFNSGAATRTHKLT